jgi:large subunit ribosomal protein L30
MLAVIRVRGYVNLDVKIREAFKHLSLDRVNYMVLIPEEATRLGQVKKTRDYITFGQIDEATLALVLEKKARLSGDKRLDEAFLKTNKFDSFQAMAKALMEGKTKLVDLKVKKVFRLKPPRKGFGRKGIKKTFVQGGALGDRKEKINDLIKRMV